MLRFMSPFHYRAVSISLSCLLAIILTIATAASAFASGGGGLVSSAVTGGSLTETNAAPGITNATLNGLDQALTITLPFTIDDSTGSGLGWNVTITSTTFTNGTHTLSNSATTVTGVTASCHSGSTCTLPDNAITYNLTVPAATSAPSPTKLFNAAANTGMGEIDLSPAISVALPANVYAGTYSSTITLAVLSTP